MEKFLAKSPGTSVQILNYLALDPCVFRREEGFFSSSGIRSLPMGTVV